MTDASWEYGLDGVPSLRGMLELVCFFLYKGKVHFGDTSEACDLADFNQGFFFFYLLLPRQVRILM